MKRMILLLLALCLALCTACTKEPEIPDAPDTPPAVTEQEPAVDPAPQPELSEEKDALPVYIYHSESGMDAAVDEAGTILVLGEAGSLSLIRDVVTAQPRFIQYVLPKESEDAPARCRLYDLSGESVVEPMGSYVAVSGNLMSCYDMASDTHTVYRISDGGVVTQAPNVWLLGDVVVTKDREFQAPSTAVDAAGKELWTQEENWFTGGYYRDGERFYVAVTDPQDRVGLIDAYGQEILPMQYAQIGTVTDGRAAVRDDEGWAVVDLATGETLMRWPYLIATVFEDAAIVQSDENVGRYTLAGFDGQLRTELTFQWLDTVDDDFDGVPELLCGKLDYSQEQLPEGVTALQETTVFLRPNGEEVYRHEYTEDSFMPISSTLALRRQKEPAGCFLVDLAAGTQTPLEGRQYVFAEMPWYYTSDPQAADRAYFTVSYEVAPEQLLTCIMDTDGNVVLDELTACTYLGNGVFQVSQYGMSGLWTTDGNWLYIAQENAA